MEQIVQVGPTEVVLGNGLPGQLLPQKPNRQRVAVLTQPGATARAATIAADLGTTGLKVEVVGLPDREEAKTLEVAASVYEILARIGLGRSDSIVGVGGGSVTDLAGFVGATWLRGIEVVHFPTTLVAAVDASIGGKTGVNLEGKNLVGVYWHPSRVVVDIDLLAELPSSLIQEGMAEILKCGLIDDPELFEMVRADGMEVSMRDAVMRSLMTKARFVSLDERDDHQRMMLNFGHTVGHAVEYASSLPHGHSVAIGIRAAVAISEERFGLERGEDVRDALHGLGLPESVRGLDRARIDELLLRDKKREGAAHRMVLLEDIGKPSLVEVSEAELEVGLAAVGL